MLKNENRSIFGELKALLSNKLYLVVLILITAASYGFTITHPSLGIDDFGTYHYLNLSPDSVRNMLQQGRLLHIVFYYIFDLATVNPFINNFISAILFALSAALFCALIKCVCPDKFSAPELSIFSALYISCSITSFKFIYDIDVVVTILSYAAIPLSIYYFLRFLDSKKLSAVIIGTLWLLCGISSYESFIMVYICEVLFLLIICHVWMEMKTADVFRYGFFLALCLGAVLGIYYGAVNIIQKLTGNVPITQHSLLTVDDKIGTVLSIIKESFFKRELLFVNELLVFAVVFAVTMLVYTVFKKKPLCLLLFPALGLFVILMPILHAYAHYRTYQTVPLFIACAALLALDFFKNTKYLRRAATALLCTVILWQTVDINRWFYKDWVNYEKTVYAIHKIATDLHESYSVDTKPVCFTNRDYNSFIMTWDNGVQYEIGESPLIAAVSFLGDDTSDAVIALFEYQGYDFLIKPTEEQADRAYEIAKEMPSYPKQGYIYEADDVIVVNIGKQDWWG